MLHIPDPSLSSVPLLLPPGKDRSSPDPKWTLPPCRGRRGSLGRRSLHTRQTGHILAIFLQTFHHMNPFPPPCRQSSFHAPARRGTGKGGRNGYTTSQNGMFARTLFTVSCLIINSCRASEKPGRAAVHDLIPIARGCLLPPFLVVSIPTGSLHGSLHTRFLISPIAGSGHGAMVDDYSS
ncbi:hypothetical protein N7510_004307 [Penicillium lagena]|uniref:uncharacterized protein n=1 Tax=Penicillium lagena TaxID=94218 RepID=UPI0025419A1F|nr:uncharacterized protein N7510_004307 [Penicillium lagena]KAJ5620323.1 hypothetical protein N7510_004307 [Penicillium lagena]